MMVRRSGLQPRRSHSKHFGASALIAQGLKSPSQIILMSGLKPTTLLKCKSQTAFRTFLPKLGHSPNSRLLGN